MRIFNQFTERLSVREIASRIAEVGNRMGLDVRLTTVPNPRLEREEHYYNPQHRALLDLGLQPRFLTDDVVADLLERVCRHRRAIDTGCIMPRVRWVGE